MKLTAAAVSILGLLAPAASAMYQLGVKLPGLPLLSDSEVAHAESLTSPGPNFGGPLQFQQLIDHANPSLGTFSQRYWWSNASYAGPGSPVVLFNGGESNAEGATWYITNYTLPGLFAQGIGGAGVLLEHRYWGKSSPYQKLSTANMKYLTLNNSIADMTYFAKNVVLPFDLDRSSRPDRAPWVLSGGSYSGALSAWTAHLDPGTFWAYHASSAPVQAIGDYWQYYTPIQKGMAKNCSADMNLVMDYMDKVLQTGSPQDKVALKTLFGLQGVPHDADFVSALVPNGLWQSIDYSDTNNTFFLMCDYIENVWPGSSAAVPGPEGVGLEKALAGYAKWSREIMVPDTCDSYGYSDWSGRLNVACFDTYNLSSPWYTDLSPGNQANRQWMYMLCNEPFEWWQNAPPSGMPTLVSRLINMTYSEHSCPLFFPPEDGATYGIAAGKTPDTVNAYTGGWTTNVNPERVVYTSGEFDPWREATVSSDTRPGGPLVSTATTPVFVIPGREHTPDLLTSWGKKYPAVKAVQDAEIAIMKQWVREFYAGKK